MNEARVYADGFERSFAEVKDLLEFLAERGRNAKWIRKPTNTLRLAPLEKEAQNLDAADASMEEILEDTEKNTQLVLKMRGESYPVRDCAIRTILSRAGVNGDGLRKLDKATYAKVVNYCLRVAKGDALIKIADGKVSAVHGGDKHDYCILDMKAMFETTCEYLNLNFKGSVYMEGSGIYDHSIVSAMWKLGGSQELLDTYRKALDAHGMDEKILSPALRFTTSDVAASGANLYPMLLTDGPNGVISLGSPIKLAHDKGATILDFRKNLEQVCARYVDAMKNLNYGGFADKSIPEIVLSGLESKNLEKYLTLSEEKSQLEKRKKEIEAEQRAISVPFVEQLGQGCKAVLEDGTNRYRITYNPTRRTSVGKDQMEKLKNQHPDIYEEYTKTTESRTFRIKKEAA